MASRITVTVLYFAAVRERLGTERDTLTLDAGATVKTLIGVLERQHPNLRSLVPHLRVAVNQEFVAMDETIPAGSEVALVPPVAGGTAPFWISEKPISLSEVLGAVSSQVAKGGLVTFSGVVRGETRGRRVLRLEYEAYLPMAEKKLAEIAKAAQRRWPGCSLAIAHRIGVLVPGDLAVAIAVSAPHRKEAFQACEFSIDRLKEEAPIWKKEVYADGDVWIGLGP